MKKLFTILIFSLVLTTLSGQNTNDKSLSIYAKKETLQSMEQIKETAIESLTPYRAQKGQKTALKHHLQLSIN